MSRKMSDFPRIVTMNYLKIKAAKKTRLFYQDQKFRFLMKMFEKFRVFRAW